MIGADPAPPPGSLAEPTPRPALEELLARLASGQFDLSPVEELALRYIAQERANAKTRTQANLYRLFSTTSNGALATASNVAITNHVIPDQWVIRMWAFTTTNVAFNYVVITQGGSDPVDVMVPTQGTRVVLPGFRPDLLLTNVTGGASVIYVVAAVSGWDFDIL